MQRQEKPDHEAAVLPTIAPIAELLRFVHEIQRIRTDFLAVRVALADVRADEIRCGERGDRRGRLGALERIVCLMQMTFDSYAQFRILVAEIDPATDVAMKLCLLATDEGLAPQFAPNAGIIELIDAGADSTLDELGGIHQLRLWGANPGVRASAQRAREARNWLRATLSAEERGGMLFEVPSAMH
jgi:hypothetical protein